MQLITFSSRKFLQIIPKITGGRFLESSQ